MCPPGSKKKQCNAASIELRGFGVDRLGRRRIFLFQRVQFRRRGIERHVVAVAQQGAVSGPRLRRRAAVELRAALGRLLRLHFRGLRREEALHALRQLEVEAFHLRDLLGHGRPDAPERSKMAEQRALALVADAGDLLQDRAEVALAAQLAVEGDGEPVRLVAPASFASPSAICVTSGSGPARSAHASATRKPWRAAKRSSSSSTRLFASPASGRSCSVRAASFSAARATFSCPLPPSTTRRSGRFCSSMPRLSLRVSTWNMEAKSSPAASPRTLNN